MESNWTLRFNPEASATQDASTIAAHQKHLPQFSMKLATQETSVLMRGSGTFPQTFLMSVKTAVRQKINAPVWPRLETLELYFLHRRQSPSTRGSCCGTRRHGDRWPSCARMRLPSRSWRSPTRGTCCCPCHVTGRGASSGAGRTTNRKQVRFSGSCRSLINAAVCKACAV